VLQALALTATPANPRADHRLLPFHELQALTRQLEASGTSVEEITQSQANYLINQEKPLWSDALEVLYLTENSSPEATQTI
jgi:hypothetical protein